MGLLFDADNEVVNCGNSAAINNLAAGTMCVWVYFNTVSDNTAILLKSTGWPGTHDIFLWNHNTDEILMGIERATTDLQAESSDSPLSTGKWFFIAARWDCSGVNGDQQIFVGDLTSLAAEVGGYSTQTIGAGARSAGAVDLGIGGLAGGSPAWVNQDEIIAVVALFNTNISLGRIQSFQFRPRKMDNCVGLWFPGLHGSTNFPDLSGNGNNGTITNATVSIHIPIGLHFGFDASVMPGPLGGTQSMAGAVAAVSLVDGALSLTWSFAGAVAAISSADGTLSVTWSLAGTPAGVSSVSGSLSVTGEVTLVGAVDAAAALCGILSLHRPGPWFSGLLETEKTWLAGALFGGVGANAFKLGTVLSLGWFWVRWSGCLVLYRGPSMRQIDFANVLTVEAQDAGLISPPVYIPHDGGSIYFYVVRRFNNCGYQEHTLAAAVKLVFDAQGDIAEPTPNGIFASRAEQIDADRVWLIWHYCPLEQKSAPACFNVYCDSGTGQIDYDNPIATLGYEGRKFYNCESSALGADRYLFAIRAEDAAGIQNHSLAQMGIQLSTTSPDPISILDVGGV